MMLETEVVQGQIATARFVLRRVRISDAGLFAMYAGDRRVAEATQGIPHPLPPGTAEAFVARAMSTGTDEDIWVMDGTLSGLPEVLGVKPKGDGSRTVGSILLGGPGVLEPGDRVRGGAGPGRGQPTRQQNAVCRGVSG